MVSEAAEIQTQLQEKWLIFWWAFGASLLAVTLAWRKGLIKPIHYFPSPPITGVDVLRGFIYFLSISLLIIPSLFGVGLVILGLNPVEALLNPEIRGIINLTITLGGFLGALLAYLQLSRDKRKQLWRSDAWLRRLAIGIAFWFVSFPVVLALSELISIIVWHLFHHSFVEQVAVQHIRETFSSTYLFVATAFSVVFLVPFAEEFLFRGLLQNWLKTKLHHTPSAILLSSFVFASFHYSPSHGFSNIELLSTLFILSCLLGYIYEQQRSLWTPIGLHGFFNFMSLIMLFFKNE